MAVAVAVAVVGAVGVSSQTRNPRRGRVALLLCTAFSIVCVSRACAGEVLSPPFMVFVNTHEWRPDALADTYELAKSVARDTDLKLRSRADLRKRHSRGVPFLQSIVPFTHGSVYCLTPAGETRKAGFHTIPTEQQFRELIDREVARRTGAVTKTEFDGLKVRLSSPPAVRDPSEPKSKPLLSWMDSYWSWQNGTVVFGSRPYVYDVSLSRLQPHIRRARDHDYYLYLEPSEIPHSMRESVIARFGTWVGVRMQRQDNEGEQSAAVRKALGGEAFDLVESLLFEPSAISGSAQYPDGEKNGHCHLELTCQRHSQLAKLLRELRSGGHPLSVVPDDAPISMAVNLGLPSAVRDALRALIVDSGFKGSRLGEALTAAVDDGAVRCAAWLNPHQETAVFSGVAASPFESISSVELAAVIGGHVDDTGACVVPVSSESVEETSGPRRVSIIADNNQFRFSIPFADNESGDNNQIVRSPDDGDARLGRDALVQVDIDLSHVEDDATNKAISTFCREAEKWYLWWRLSQMPAGLKRFEFGSESPDIPITSLIAGERVGDYSFSFTLSAPADGTSLRADFRMGKEFFGLLFARRLRTNVDLSVAGPSGR